MMLLGVCHKHWGHGVRPGSRYVQQVLSIAALNQAISSPLKQLLLLLSLLGRDGGEGAVGHLVTLTQGRPWMSGGWLCGRVTSEAEWRQWWAKLGTAVWGQGSGVGGRGGNYAIRIFSHILAFFSHIFSG